MIAREIPVMVPPVPAPATNTSTLPEEGWAAVDGVAVTAATISGPVVSSCARGLLGCIAYRGQTEYSERTCSAYVAILVEDDPTRDFTLEC